MTGDEWAKAGQEIAKAASKGIGAAEKAGGFFGRYVEGPLEQISGLVIDRLKYARWERQIRLMRRAEEFLKAQGLEMPTRKVAMSIGIPLIEAASLEEDDALQDRWAALLARAGNANSDVDVRRVHVSILKDLGPLEVKMLEMVVDAPVEYLDVRSKGRVLTYGFPGRYEHHRAAGAAADLPLPSLDVEIALWNLCRLGCLEPDTLWQGTQVAGVMPTALGKSMVRACSLPKN